VCAGAVPLDWARPGGRTISLPVVSRMLDLAPLDRNQEGLEFAGAWWHRHDEYEDAAAGETG
jgi:hypothetical protein